MPTTYNDQFYPNDPWNLPVPIALSVVNLTMIDENDDNFIGPGDTVNGSNVTAAYNGDTITVNGVTITGVTFYTADGGRYFTPTDGSVLADGTATASTFVNSSTGVNVGDLSPACFARGTMIQTPDGPRAVQDLRLGDLVETLDDGPQPIRWIGRTRCAGSGKGAPVVFAPGTMGNAQELVVSQQHRMLVNSPLAEMHFGNAEVLVSARNLVNGHGIRIEERPSVEYFHLMFDRHQIIIAGGVPSESYYLGGQLPVGLDFDARAELQALFPDLETEMRNYGDTARYCLKKYEAAIIARRAA